MEASEYFVVRCLLSAKLETRRQLWLLMERYTLLINKLLELLPQSPEFTAWRESGYIPNRSLVEFIEMLKSDSQYSKLPGRFYTSAKILIQSIYKSWFALQRKYSRKISGKLRWIQVLQRALLHK